MILLGCGVWRGGGCSYPYQHPYLLCCSDVYHIYLQNPPYHTIERFSNSLRAEVKTVNVIELWCFKSTCLNCTYCFSNKTYLLTFSTSNIYCRQWHKQASLTTRRIHKPNWRSLIIHSNTRRLTINTKHVSQHLRKLRRMSSRCFHFE